MPCRVFSSSSRPATQGCAAAVNIPHPSSVGSSPPPARPGLAHVATTPSRPETGRGSKPSAKPHQPSTHKPSYGSLRALKEPAIGCGYEICLLLSPAGRLNEPGVAAAAPKQWSVASALNYGACLQRTECPIDRGVVPSTLSLCHSVSWRNQAAGKRPQGHHRTPLYGRCQPDARQMPSPVPTNRRLQHGGAGGAAPVRPEPASALCACRPLAATVQEVQRPQPTAPRRAQKHSEERTSTWRSTHLGRMYDGGAPGQASGRLSWAGPKNPLLIPPCLL
ncbi:hypothetical protein PTT_11109 [Pyrenophora teres f. teres 0-1]|uniref:Uncharacterized protein n=1 Tax=Pyrenophora teres f. teres (strain 0-1) TaxID=861557 RepID=E3RQS6_PYRTT|nr:hypothetical protein PTT_11109 [Pyrenophora teres f. teres 0-1]